MRNLYKISLLIIGLFLIGSSVKAQDIQFYYTVQYNTPIEGKTKVTMWATNVGTVLRTMSTFQLSFPFNSDEFTLATIDLHPNVDLLEGGCCWLDFQANLGTTNIGAPYTCDGVGGYDLKCKGAPTPSIDVMLDPAEDIGLIEMVFNISGGGDACLQGNADSPLNEYSGNEGVGIPMIIIDPQTQALPVEFVKFSAKPLRNIDTDLNWIVTSESNVSHYEVERYESGGSWTVVGQVDVNEGIVDGDLKSYHFVDRNAFNGRVASKTFFYRLNVVDNDGAGGYSKIESVLFKAGLNNPLTVQTFPNPSTDWLIVNLIQEGSATPASDLVIYNSLGQMVHSEVIPEGADRIQLDYSRIGIVSGTYMLHLVEGDNTLAQEKIIVQR